MPDRAARRDPALFGKTMGMVAGAAGCFALGSYAGRHVATGLAIVAYLAAFGCLLSLSFAARRRAGASSVLLAGFGILAGAAVTPTVVYYSAADPRVLWEAGGSAGMLTAACGVAAYLTLPNLTPLARIVISEALAVLLCGIALVSEHMPRGTLVNSGIAVGVYAAVVILGFLWCRRLRNVESACLLAASIFAGPVSAFFFLLRNAYVNSLTRAQHRPRTLPP
ncbi:MAG: Bax inhibitor-1 family protein [Trebonia sp.]